ncbi:ABC transporter permease [Agrococcus sp. HG114]|uniref:ABC transporter permease n=1 Tax=Agrococcus sp. HG114 TaxID=2969757 RepID=UPI00215A90CD|nr:ABC transporter permease [Agrococcus sp. HG114]MCR8670426.1 ABC transporter permease [Agrococcus sp. HG114]
MATDAATARAARLAGEPWESAATHGRGLAGFAAAIADMWRYRELFGLLTRRELKARYKDSRLGFLWSLVRPLVMLLVYALVVGEFLGAARAIPDFAIYIFAGLAIYTLFSEILSAGTNSLVANAGLIKKVYLPREIFPLATVGPALFTLGIQLVILIVAALVVGTLSIGAHLGYALLAIVLMVTFGAALAVVLSAINVYLRDVAYLVEVVLVLGMWASPILYSLSMATERFEAAGLGWLSPIYTNSPVTLAVLGFQEAFWQPGFSEQYVGDLWVHLVIAILASAALAVGAQRVFSRLQGNFAQEL